MVTKTKPKYRITVFRSTRSKAKSLQCWYWHLQSLVGKKPIVCTSGEPFDSRANALRAGRRMRTLLTEGLGLSVIDFVIDPT